MVLSNKHVANINRALKDIKSDVMTDFIRADSRGLMITINKVASTSYLNTIENYIKNIDVVDSNNVMSPRLPQSKSYLKILGIPYLIEDTNILITADVVERILQSTHIFNDIVLVSWPRVIKASLKSDMAIIWVNIWDTLSGSKAKCLINRCFNVRSHICYKLKTLGLVKKKEPCIGFTQENSIESSLQSSLPYILLQMVCVSYCAPYSKWPCVKHEANMWCPCCMTSLCSRTFS